MPTFKWVCDQLIASETLTQLSRCKRAESNLLADQKCPQRGDPGSCLMIHLYYRFIVIGKSNLEQV